MRNLKSCIESHVDIKFDSHLLEQLVRLRIGFLNKNRDHLEFFGGVYTGIQTVRWSTVDFGNFYDILGIDPIILEGEIHQLPHINKDFKVASDVFNLVCMYLVHGFLNSKLIDSKKRELGATTALLIFNYKCLSSLIYQYFKYPCDPKLAKATYDSLSLRFLIKKCKSWQDVLEYRCKEILATDSETGHRKELVKFNDDLKITYCVTDSQGRIRDMLKNIYGKMIEVQQNNGKVIEVANTQINADGESVFKDRTEGVDTYSNYCLGIIHDRNSFIRAELTSVIVKLMPTMQERAFEEVLDWMSMNILGNHRGLVEEFVKTILGHSHNYLTSNEFVFKNTTDLSIILPKLKAVYGSSRSTDEELLRIRDQGAEVIKIATGKTNEQIVAAIRTGVSLYICLRTYTMKHYSGS